MYIKISLNYYVFVTNEIRQLINIHAHTHTHTHTQIDTHYQLSTNIVNDHQLVIKKYSRLSIYNRTSMLSGKLGMMSDYK